MTDTRPIAVPYDPDQVEGDFGWIWTDAGSEWLFIRTIVDGDGDLMIEAWDPESGVQSCAYAEAWAGKPYIPHFSPRCGPKAGAMVCVWLPGGGTITVAHEDCGPEAQALVDGVLAVVRGDDGQP